MHLNFQRDLDFYYPKIPKFDENTIFFEFSQKIPLGFNVFIKSIKIIFKWNPKIYSFEFSKGNFIIFLNNPKILFAFQNLMKIESLSMFLSNLGKFISIQVKSKNLYSFEFSKGFKFLYFLNNPKFLPIFAFQNLMKIVS